LYRYNKFCWYFTQVDLSLLNKLLYMYGKWWQVGGEISFLTNYRQR